MLTPVTAPLLRERLPLLLQSAAGKSRRYAPSFANLIGVLMLLGPGLLRSTAE